MIGVLVRCWLCSVRAISRGLCTDSHDVYFTLCPLEPFLILLLAGVLGLALSGARGSVLHCPFGRDAGGDYLVGVLMLSAYFMPVDCSR